MTYSFKKQYRENSFKCGSQIEQKNTSFNWPVWKKSASVLFPKQQRRCSVVGASLGRRENRGSSRIHSECEQTSKDLLATEHQDPAIFIS